MPLFLTVNAAIEQRVRAELADGEGDALLARIERYLPDELVGGPKTGFGVPFGDWLRGPLRPWAESLLDVHRVKDEGYLDSQAVDAAWKEKLMRKAR